MTTNKQSNLDKRLEQGAKRLFVWTFAWVFSLAVLAFGPKFIWNFNDLISLLVIAINLSLGIKMLLENKRHLDDMDDLQRKVHFNAMAISLGVTMILGAVYGLLKPIGLLENTPSPGNLLFVMGISYMVTVFINFRKYL